MKELAVVGLHLHEHATQKPARVHVPTGKVVCLTDSSHIQSQMFQRQVLLLTKLQPDEKKHWILLGSSHIECYLDLGSSLHLCNYSPFQTVETTMEARAALKHIGCVQILAWFGCCSTYTDQKVRMQSITCRYFYKEQLHTSISTKLSSIWHLSQLHYPQGIAMCPLGLHFPSDAVGHLNIVLLLYRHCSHYT